LRKSLKGDISRQKIGTHLGNVTIRRPNIDRLRTIAVYKTAEQSSDEVTVLSTDRLLRQDLSDRYNNESFTDFKHAIHRVILQMDISAKAHFGRVLTFRCGTLTFTKIRYFQTFYVKRTVYVTG